MTRLIDADTLDVLTIIGGRMDSKVEFAKAVNEMIQNALTVDAVPVIRCVDCRWGRETCGNIECQDGYYHGYDWFCPNGERKEE